MSNLMMWSFETEDSRRGWACLMFHETASKRTDKPFEGGMGVGGCNDDETQTHARQGHDLTDEGIRPAPSKSLLRPPHTGHREPFLTQTWPALPE